jgi:outer membrane protein TolC
MSNPVRPALFVLVGWLAFAAGCASVGERTAFEQWEQAAETLERDRQGRNTVPLPGAPTLDDCLRVAALNNPGLEAAFYRWKAALERIPQARSLPDPRFTYRYFIEQVETRVGPQRHGVGVAQTFPWFGTLDRRADAALENARAARRRYQACKWRLFRRVSLTYAELYYLGRARSIVRGNRDLVKHLEAVARTRYKTAAAGHQDVIRAQVELGKLEDRLRTLEDLIPAVAAELNAVMNRPHDAALPAPDGVPIEELGATDKALLTRLRTANPELRALDREIDRRRAELELARLDFFPDVTLGLDYIDTSSARAAGVPGSGKDPVIARISINLPIWVGKYRAGEREARARLRATVRERTEREKAQVAEARRVLYELRDAARKVRLYRDTLLPKATQGLRATETAFTAGKASFLDLIDAQRVLLEFQLAHERARADRVRRLGELDALLGERAPRKAANKEETE